MNRFAGVSSSPPLVQHESSAGFLKITSVSTRDGGNYVCEAVNALGQARKIVKVSLTGNSASTMNPKFEIKL